MAEMIMKAPTFQTVLTSAADIATQTAYVTFVGEDNKKYQVGFSSACAPLAIAILAGELGKLLTSTPQASQRPVQPIVVKGAQLGMRDNGQAALILTLESGAELPLEFALAHLRALAGQFAELERLADKKSHH